MKWQPIDTAPATPMGADEDPPSILVWIADSGPGGRGEVSFGYVYLSNSGQRRVKASGYGGTHEWKITHWMPLPDPPSDAS